MPGQDVGAGQIVAVVFDRGSGELLAVGEQLVAA
jgi:hypothetical protein